MKKVIYGKTYNTETAESIAKYSCTVLKEDKDLKTTYLKRVYDQLFRTRKGDYFSYTKEEVKEVQLPLMDEEIDEGFMRKYENIHPISENSAFRCLLDNGCFQELGKHFPQRTADYLEGEKCIGIEFLTLIKEARSELEKSNKIQILEYSRDMKWLYFRIKDFPYNFSFNLDNDSSDYSKLGKFASDIRHGSMHYDIKQLAESNYGEYIFLKEYDVTFITFPIQNTKVSQC